jgi:uracil-DNA glycosylase
MKIALPEHWISFLAEDFIDNHINETLEKIQQKTAQHQTRIFPPEQQIFKAFELLKPNEIKVVILGQDPYPTFGHANGLAFSVNPDVKPLPKSLHNIYKEIKSEYPNFEAKNGGDLSHWAKQGVLLLNTVLSVEEGKPGSHFDLGWEVFTDLVIKKLGENKELIFVLWGKHAEKKEKLIQHKTLIFKTPHPSPLSAYRGFFGSNLFLHINEALLTQKKSPINW